jgi:glutamate-1-semialdehyde 2,1-aminomutase
LSKIQLHLLTNKNEFIDIERLVNMTHSDAVKNAIINRYIERTSTSRSLDQRAKKSLPGGDTRWSTYYMPYPVYMKAGSGPILYDVDGNEYIDLQNNYTVLVHGHAYPEITTALQEQVKRSVIYGAPAEEQFVLADLLTGRLPGVDQVRYTNSGTEATMLAMRAARAFTNKPIILKMDGGYHGTHDFVEVNVSPDLSDQELPIPHVENGGVPAAVLNATMVARFNDLESVERILQAHHHQIAAIITEPLMNAAGIIVPHTAFLPGLRALADRYNVLLIFDEVVTFRLDIGGYQRKTGVIPDLTALGKVIGGGLPIGAFGGRADIMQRFDPAVKDGFHHSGTFNGNSMAMVAGIAAVKALTEDAILHINRIGETLREGIEEAFLEAGIRGCTTGEGSLLYIHWTASEIQNAADVVRWKQHAAELPRLLHLELLNHGIFTANRGLLNVSTPMTDAHVDRILSIFRQALFTLKPYIAEVAPQLIY